MLIRMGFWVPGPRFKGVLVRPREFFFFSRSCKEARQLEASAGCQNLCGACASFFSPFTHSHPPTSYSFDSFFGRLMRAMLRWSSNSRRCPFSSGISRLVFRQIDIHPVFVQLDAFIKCGRERMKFRRFRGKHPERWRNVTLNVDFVISSIMDVYNRRQFMYRNHWDLLTRKTGDYKSARRQVGKQKPSDVEKRNNEILMRRDTPPFVPSILPQPKIKMPMILYA